MNKALLLDLLLRGRAGLNKKIDQFWSRDTNGSMVRAPREDYLELFEAAKKIKFEDIVSLENETGFALDPVWLNELALHTQIVIKKSQLNYSHGRMLYALLRRYIFENKSTHITIVETGTARGFSALCMAKALEDAGIDGYVITLDILPQHASRFWNCIDDHEGAKSRAELLSPWQELLRRIIFLQGDSHNVLWRVGVERVNFAFLDAQHTCEAVLEEFSRIAPRQQKGDVIFFDDVTPRVFPGVVSAIDQIESGGLYQVTRSLPTPARGYAWAVRR